MNKKLLVIIFKIAFAFLAFAAIITEYATLTERGQFNALNFFSYFTIQSNLIIIVSLLISAMYMVARRKSHALDMFRGAAAFYIITTGIVFLTLLAGLDPRLLTAVPVDNSILHYILPIVGLIDWLIDRPQTALLFRRALIWIAYPLLYVVYSIARGMMVGWYPYPFLNVDANGVMPVVTVVTVIAVMGVFGVYAFSRTTRRSL